MCRKNHSGQSYSITYMKHSFKIIAILISMFFLTQLIGIAVVNQYSPTVEEFIDVEGNVQSRTTYNLPYGMDPPEGTTPTGTLISIVLAITIAVVLMLVLMKFKAELLLRVWFLLVVTLALGITLNAFLPRTAYASLITLIIALPLALLKLFHRNIYVHNFTELLIYPGIAAIFVPLLNIWTVVLLLILISIYDMYAVWHAGFMQKMAEYQIKHLKFFTGFFLPYLGGNEKKIIAKAKSSATSKSKKVKVNVAILGGGDVIFPIILSGVVLNTLGFLQALIIAIGATIALAWLFYISKKGKFYPAMPFITIGCLIALAVAYFV
jgi:presenilin-like A22 family membrane protease